MVTPEWTLHPAGIDGSDSQELNHENRKNDAWPLQMVHTQVFVLEYVIVK